MGRFASRPLVRLKSIVSEPVEWARSRASLSARDERRERRVERMVRTVANLTCVVGLGAVGASVASSAGGDAGEAETFRHADKTAAAVIFVWR